MADPLVILPSQAGLKAVPRHGGPDLLTCRQGDAFTPGGEGWRYGTVKGVAGWLPDSALQPPPVIPPGPIVMPGPVAPLGVPGKWALSWSDEFEGTVLDTSKWSANWLGAPGAITPPVNSSEFACYDPAQVSIVNGELHLTAIANPATVGGKTYPYRSGLIQSNGKFNQAYGCFESRIWLPAGAGLWPAFWTDGQHWPADGEIDVLEAYGTDESCSFHYHYSGGGPGGNATVVGSTTGWHTYAAHWQPGLITWWYDGKQVWQYSTGIVSVPHFIILNLGAQTAQAAVPAVMRCDYVRVWQQS